MRRTAFHFLVVFSCLTFIKLYGATVTPELRVIETSGPAAILPKGATVASPVVKGLPLQVGDRLITNDKGRVQLATKQGTVLELREKSYCRIQNISQQKTSFFLRAGKLLGRFAPSKETGMTYRVRTPLIVASVRGTELGVTVEDNGVTLGGVVEGAVDFKKPANGPAATMNWSDEDPRWDEEEMSESEPASAPTALPQAVAASSASAVVVETSQGIAVAPEQEPHKLPFVPPVIVSELAWFQSVRATVPKLRDEWKDLDLPSQMKMRQGALRETIKWQIPAKLQPQKPAPQKIQIPKHEIPKPK